MRNVKAYFVLSLTVFLAAGCNRKDQIAQEDYFTKKIECQKLVQKLDSKISEENNRDDFTIRRSAKVESMFYSAKRNSCVYVKRTSIQNKIQKSYSTHWDLYDGLSGELLESEFGYLPFDSEQKSEVQAENDFKEKITKYSLH